MICAVYGPHAQTGRDTSFSEEGQLQCDFSYSPFAAPGGRRQAKGGRGDDERELSTLLRQTLQASVQVSLPPVAAKLRNTLLTVPGRIVGVDSAP